MMRLGCKVTVFLPYSQIFIMFFDFHNVFCLLGFACIHRQSQLASATLRKIFEKRFGWVEKI